MYRIKTYFDTRLIYKKYFKEPNQIMWPLYWNCDDLQRGHHGFVWLWVSNFIEFHQEFSKTEYVEQEEIQKLLVREMGLLRQTSKRRTKNQESQGEDNFSEPEQSVFRNTFLKRSEVSSFLSSEEIKNTLKFARGHTIGNTHPETKLDQVKELDNETQMRHSSVIKVDDFDLAYEPVKIKQVQLNNTHTIESELTEEQEQAVKAGSIKLSMVENLNQDDVNNEGREYLDHLKANWNYQKVALQAKLKNYKIPQIVFRNFKFQINTDSSLTEQCFEEYKNYLLLTRIVAQDQQLVPSFLVKLAWDYHVIETGYYTKFCKQIFGAFINCSSLPRIPNEETFANYQKTKDLYSFVFKKACTQVIWPGIVQAFNYNEIYSFKFINIRGYMEYFLKMSKEKSGTKKKTKEIIYYDKETLIKARAEMQASDEPERGEEFILVKAEQNEKN